MYAQRIREALAGSIDTGKLAEAWAALHPGAFSKGLSSEHEAPAQVAVRREPQGGHGAALGGAARGVIRGERQAVRGDDAGAGRSAAVKAVNPALAAFLAAAARAIRAALSAVLGDLWTEGWVLGQLAAQAALTGDPVDWRDWTPADVDAARQVANGGLQRLLADADIRIQSIAESRVGELADVLENALASDVITIEPYHKPPGVYSMQNVLPPRNSTSDLAAKLEDVLDNPARAKMVAHTEMARAASAATLESYRETDVREKSWLGAGDAKECPVCDANEAQGAVPMGTPFAGGVMAPPQHPMCRCALMPVVA